MQREEKRPSACGRAGKRKKPSMATQQDIIKQFMHSLDETTLRGTAALDEAVRACSSYWGMQDLIDHFVSDAE